MTIVTQPVVLAFASVRCSNRPTDADLMWSFEAVAWGPSRRGMVAVVLVLASLIFASDSAARQSARIGIERLIRGNHLDEAEQQLWETLRAHPTDVWALDLLGTVRLKQERNAEAQALFQRAYSLNPQEVPALRGLGEEARSAGR